MDRLTARGWRVSGTSSKVGRVARLLDMMMSAVGWGSSYDVAVIDVYSGRSFVWAEAAAAMVRLRGKPLVLTLRGGALPAFARRWPGRVRRLLAGATAVVSPSTYLRDAFDDLRDDVVLISNPLDLDRYRFRVRAPAEPRLLWLRAFHDIYAPDLAVQVFRRVLDAHPDATLGMAGPDRGDGSLEGARREAARLNVGGQVEFLGPVSKSRVPELMDQADIYLNTSRVDNAPVTVLEALACGMCTVSTDVGGIPQICSHGREALLASSGDAAALAQAVLRVIREPELARALSSRGRERAEEFQWSRILPRWEELLRAASRRRPALLTPDPTAS